MTGAIVTIEEKYFKILSKLFCHKNVDSLNIGNFNKNSDLQTFEE